MDKQKKQIKISQEDELKIAYGYSGGIKKRRHVVRLGKLLVAGFWDHGAIVEPTIPIEIFPTRIKRELKAAENIWHTKDGERKINFIMVYFNPVDIFKNAETLTNSDIDDLIRIGRQHYKDVDVYLFYLNGNFVQGDKNAIARSYERDVDGTQGHLIIMTNDARQRVTPTGVEGNDYFLAHEFGHIMYFTNYYGDKSDPKPNKDHINKDGKPDYGHHDDNTPEDRNNLMAPSITLGTTPTITDEQVLRALECRFFIF
ncbi:hypothetical protein [Priestia aryabhattai]|uniref:hypothetical protein n=1 Tax=Priestia aryabhattai TaxID=412384 RepID=UPI0032E85D05